MQISLELIQSSPTAATFRVAFHSATQRCLLPYPQVTGLKFVDASQDTTIPWRTHVMASGPIDDFVLEPGAKIAFELTAKINMSRQASPWTIDLPPGDYRVHFAYHVERDAVWYDFLQKRSRFAAITPIWRGAVQSNTIPLVIDAQ